ncbi:hypothetical protein NDU88_001418, partial [Pleurodeles waltl]
EMSDVYVLVPKTECRWSSQATTSSSETMVAKHWWPPSRIMEPARAEDLEWRSNAGVKNKPRTGDHFREQEMRRVQLDPTAINEPNRPGPRNLQVMK